MTSEEREHLGQTNDRIMGRRDRLLSLLGGGTLTVYGLRRRDPLGYILIAAGGGLIVRGATGFAPLYRVLGINTADTHPGPAASVGHKEGIKIERSVTINRSPAELYRFWRNFENLPRIMDHLESVKVLDDRRSHWVAKAPLGRRAEWDAEIITEHENELIGWRSLNGSGIANAGSVHFAPAPGNRGTEVTVALEYDPPGGPLGALIARLFGEEPTVQVREDLRRFKRIMETGEAITTHGQPTGR